MASNRKACSLQASALNICSSIVLSRRIFKVKYSHQRRITFTEKSLKIRKQILVHIFLNTQLSNHICLKLYSLPITIKLTAINNI